jgi:flavin-binding protein dodecin
MDVLTTSCTVRDGGIAEYRTSVRLYFEIEPARA